MDFPFGAGFSFASMGSGSGVKIGSLVFPKKGAGIFFAEYIGSLHGASFLIYMFPRRDISKSFFRKADFCSIKEFVFVVSYILVCLKKYPFERNPI